VLSYPSPEGGGEKRTCPSFLVLKKGKGERRRGFFFYFLRLEEVGKSNEEVDVLLLSLF